MSEHVTRDEVRRPSLMVLRHLSTCVECRSLVSPEGDVQRIIAADLREPDPHLTPDAEIFPYIDGRLGPAERELVESHIEECSRCRTDVEEIAALKRRRARSPWLIAASILVPLVAVTILWVAVRQPVPPARPRVIVAPAPPAPVEPAYQNPEWAALVATALAEGRLPQSPRLAALRDEPGITRGGDIATTDRFEPAGVVIDAVRPHFRWSSSIKGESVVMVFDEEDNEVARSPRLRDSDWIADRDLQRGKSYLWQVRVTSDDGRSVVLPTPPAPIARFHVLSQGEHDVLAEAARHHPDDHLLLAVLYAQTGMEQEAERHLRLLAARATNSAAVKRLLERTLER